MPLPLWPAPRRGWYRFPRDLSPAQIDSVRVFPGVHDAPEKRGREPQTWVPWNLASSHPELFIAPALPCREAAIPQGEEAAAHLREYQTKCVEFALSRDGGGVYMGMDLGTGKTRTSAAAALREGHRRVLVTGPLIAKGAWCGPRSDPTRCFGQDVVPLSGRKDTLDMARETMQRDGWVFCHYDILEAWTGWFLNWFRPTCVIFDELDYCRGYKSRVSRAARAVGRLNTVERRIGLSGTAVHNSVMDLWSQLDIIEPDAWGYRSQFGRRYAGMIPGEYGLVQSEPTHVREFQQRFGSIFTRVSRRDVLTELPPITRQRLEVELSTEELDAYHRAFKDIRGYLGSLGRGIAAGNTEALARTTAMMQQLSLAKVPSTLTIARQVLETQGKVVVFSWFKETARRIAKALGGLAGDPITGDMPVDKRLKIAQDFGDWNGPAAFVATIAAAGTSLNGLQAAQVIVINDLWWTTAKLLQAEGRVFRSGQVNPVDAYYGVAKDTIDEYLIEALLEKASAISKSSGDSDPGDLMSLLGSTEAEDLSAFVDKLAQRIDEWERLNA